MDLLEPKNQTKLIGLNKYINELIELFHNKSLPNKILLSGQKGLGKSTLAYHFINYVLSYDQEFSYDKNKYLINSENRSFKTILNQSNPNFSLVDVNTEKKVIDIKQIRELILNLNKSSFNTSPRFILIDNTELLNTNSINALLKILEEPNDNIIFILINNNKKILPTLISRCINFKITLTNQKIINIANELFNNKLNLLINDDLINYYSTPGNIYNLVKFANKNDFDLTQFNLKQFLNFVIEERYYKKDDQIKYMIFDLIEFYFRKVNLSFSSKIHDYYCYFIKRVSNTKKYNLDDESLFLDFQDEILNG
jgi:DNA polymerase III subunit delta'